MKLFKKWMFWLPIVGAIVSVLIPEQVYEYFIPEFRYWMFEKHGDYWMMAAFALMGAVVGLIIDRRN
jgi:hypothetical protein